ncbi:hypothetical protein AB3R30_18745 [Leptolyngbyaceae cyanobacterium UHCC 1019]
MTLEEFMGESLGQIAQASGIDRFRWCKYFRGRISPTERTLARAAKNLGMPLPELMQGVQLKKELSSKTS